MGLGVTVGTIGDGAGVGTVEGTLGVGAGIGVFDGVTAFWKMAARSDSACDVAVVKGAKEEAGDGLKRSRLYIATLS